LRTDFVNADPHHLSHDHATKPPGNSAAAPTDGERHGHGIQPS